MTIYTKAQIVERNNKEAEALFKKLNAYVKSIKGGCNLGLVQQGVLNNLTGEFFFQVDNDGRLAWDLKYLFKNSRATVTEARDYEGSYDWSSDTYNRPVSVVAFVF